MFNDNDLKLAFVKFCEEKKESCNLDEISYLKLFENVFVIYKKLVCNEEYVYLNLLESMLSFELSQYVLFFNYDIFKKYKNYFWNYSVEEGVITQQDIFDCVSLGLDFDYHESIDYFYDYEEDSHLYCDTLFEHKGSKQKQYYLIQKSSK